MPIKERHAFHSSPGTVGIGATFDVDLGSFMTAIVHFLDTAGGSVITFLTRPDDTSAWIELRAWDRAAGWTLLPTYTVPAAGGSLILPGPIPRRLRMSVATAICDKIVVEGVRGVS